MKILCDVCGDREAMVYCSADEAALCSCCDGRIHSANKLAGKHHRFSLLAPSSGPICDICQEKRAFLFCREDRAILCRDCDGSIHSANEQTRRHGRFLLTGVTISAAAVAADSVASSSSVTDDCDTASKKRKKMTAVQKDEDAGGGSSFAHYLMNTLPGWHIDELLSDLPPPPPPAAFQYDACKSMNELDLPFPDASTAGASPITAAVATAEMLGFSSQDETSWSWRSTLDDGFRVPLVMSSSAYEEQPSLFGYHTL